MFILQIRIFYCLAQYGLNVSLQISEGFEGMAFVFRRSPDTVFSLLYMI